MFIPIVNYQQPGVTDGLIRFYDPQIEMSTGSILEQSGRGPALGSGNGYSLTTTVPAYVTFLNNATNRFAVPAATVAAAAPPALKALSPGLDEPPGYLLL